jgi:hypothetical protein
MSTLFLAGIGLALLLLTIGIYLITRRLAMRAIYGPQAPGGRGYEASTEPLYETPMPRKIVTADDTGPPAKNPLIEVIEEWEEPKPKPSKKPEKKPVKKAKKKDAPSETQENPLIKFIEEWEEPK